MPTPPPFPLHRLNSPLTGAWMCKGDVQRFLAQKILRLYPGGYGLCMNTMHLIAVVNPRGGVRELHPPFVRFHMSQAHNRPSAPNCQCASFYYPESQSAWIDAGLPGHHPLCQWDATSDRVYVSLLNKAPKDQYGIAHVEKGQRPDAWQKEREATREELGLKKEARE